MKKNTQQDLVERARQSEPVAIAELYRYYWRAARAAAYGVTGNIELAEDAACEAFYAAIDSLGDLKNTQKFGPWLRTIVIRTASRIKAASIKNSTVEPQILPDTQSSTPSDNLEQTELVALIHEAMSNLSEPLREAMSLFYFEGYNIKDAAGFLDVPVGTLKRRLHEGRRQLREAAQQIISGTKPTRAKREQILKKLTEAMEEGIHSESFYQAIRQALRLGPASNELLKKIVRKHWASKNIDTNVPPEKENQFRQMLARFCGPSQRAKDPNHPIGAVANAIREALPEFQPFQPDISKANLSQIHRDILDGDRKAFSFMYPPDFTQNSEGSYISQMRAWLIQDEDGSVVKPYELMQKKDSLEALKAQLKKGRLLSDTVQLLWKRQGNLELREIQELLRRLSKTIIPDSSVHLCPYEEPSYRAALRMQLGENTIPAAIGGILNNSPGSDDKANVASVIIYLEPWASAKSGKVVKLTDFSMSLFQDNKSK
ncbi:MAG: RNA polymerase sigma factor [Planctomycetota bacterium]|jgi:RNA polymerase sigma-70 factor (ECF subfamily)